MNLFHLVYYDAVGRGDIHSRLMDLDIIKN